VLILAAIALAVLEFADPDRPWQGALYMTAGALAVTTPHYQWYSLLLVMLVALDGRPEWLAFAAGGYYAAEAHMGRYTPPWRLVNAIAYGVPLMVVAAGWLIRRELARRAAAAEIAGATGPLLLAGIPAEAATAEAVPIEAVPAGTVPAGSVPAGTAPTGGLPTGFAAGQRALSADAGREVPV
jgi:hypothetical protein